MTETSPALTIHIKNFEADLYAFIYERYVRAFTLKLDMDVGVNLTFDQQPGEPATVTPELVGLDADKARKVIEDQRFAEAVRQTEGFWMQQGISGVPAMIFDRKHLVSGAQGTENYTRILEQLSTMRA